MRMAHRSGSVFRPSLPCLLLGILLAVLWMAGGASRADAMGQVVVRSVAWTLLVVAILFAGRPQFGRARPVAIVLTVAVLLALLQLVSLPPEIWQALPGRSALTDAMAASGQDQPWRQWSIVPGATINAASALIVPVVTLFLLTGLSERERTWLPAAILALVFASTLVGLLQFSGVGFNNPFVNDTLGQVGGTFANRNHFALFLAFGCLIAPVWAVMDGHLPHWRGVVALGLVLLFVLTILATGSRAGIALGGMGFGIGLFLARQGVRRALRRYPRWVYPALLTAIVAMVVVFVLISVAADRAVSIDRVFAVDQGQDMRSRGLPVVLALIATYFPLGSGLGAFDPIFRMHEPFALLKLTYFNHAHNDFLEIVLDAGLPGLLVLLGSLGWWGWASVRAWRGGAYALPARLGSTMVLLVLLASAIDYPVRTPIIMAMMVIAGVWLCGSDDYREQALPTSDQHL